MKISYVLPVRNAQNTIAQTLRSLIKQQIKGEIIVIDDFSEDNTRDIISHYRDQIDLYIENDQHMGAAHCRNAGNRASTGDIIAVCDADIYYPDRCQAITKAFTDKEHPMDVFISGVDCRDADNIYLQWKQEAYRWDFNSKCNISHPTVAYLSKWAEICPYHELSKDTDLFEFMLLDMHKAGAVFGGCQESTMLKIEGNTERDKSVSNEVKSQMYKRYGIKI